MAATLGESDAKFPKTTTDGLPPSPSRENPGAVFPKTDPSTAPRITSPGVAVAEQKAQEHDRLAKAHHDLREMTRKQDPQSAETGGMFVE
ncbi:hypothetical protein K488DRAFT_87750 [Vararia minispora EC-137]|uniref:Uncharacterized protein n=1 Tax=Vararia minispora EC-137 TaxID=1314806 RepID=A0ACB8QFJ6_9AGAM|nr:hypothetical protein K488DRAFT_87750 [Vararia minispora EC-137]